MSILRVSDRRLALIFVCAAISAFLVLGCSRIDRSRNLTGESTASEIVSTEPPFLTKEPARYQATRVITTIETSTNSANVAPRIITTLLARDGANRREEFVLGSATRVVYLEIPSGRYVILQASKIFAALDEKAEAALAAQSLDQDLDLSPEGALNQNRVASHYQQLGNEDRNGRATTKYKVVFAAEGTGPHSEALIWVDQALGMPIRSETSYASESHSTKTIMELRDISLEVDQRLFQIPGNYQKVSFELVEEKLRAPGPSAPGGG